MLVTGTSMLDAVGRDGEVKFLLFNVDVEAFIVGGLVYHPGLLRGLETVIL